MNFLDEHKDLSANKKLRTCLVVGLYPDEVIFWGGNEAVCRMGNHRLVVMEDEGSDKRGR